MEEISQDLKTTNNINTVVSNVEEVIKQKRRTTVIVNIFTQDMKAIDTWLVHINMMYHNDAAPANYAPKLADYLNQIVQGATSFPALQMPCCLQLSTWVGNPIRYP
ncbi:uncharacterized protein LOC125763259 [Anopheles funestus]|uniref:uncharacterized protein LOC125763259 n=1 Tax=Anopheles funestus TaxID=62324 RepID=UPI0020C6C629|nr:uncharacterized protein LOC125763259 [Anopheles funestus]